VLLFGAAAGTVTVALDGLVISFWMAKRRPEWYRPLFNMSAPAVSIWCASQILRKASGIQSLFHQSIAIDRLLIPVIVFSVVYFALNSSLIALAVGFQTRMTPYRVWRDNFLWLSLNYFSAASIALLLVVYTRDVDLRFIGIIVPLLLVLYVTFKTSMGRVQDANDHVAEVNRLYLSTIETLAMAIDAKDQTTHGHIRRVQTVAVALAHRIGVADGKLLKAIEAAALLHDMGKLVVPEYILNKPGKLSVVEFEKMKLHASVGADMLMAIDFPYPVVPIVRHHHENWDGTGYPAGLSGTDIPIGARILAVVDCFDALTSDRPYRPRLTEEEALRILTERRGHMYDPLILDTFVRVHKQITHEPARMAIYAFNEIGSSCRSAGHAARYHDEDGARADEVLTLQLPRALAQATANGAVDVMAKHVRGLISCSLCVFYQYDSATDELVADHAVGEGASVVRGLRIRMGEQLSGWVGANRQTIVNSDPILDLGELARTQTPRLRSSLGTALISDEGFIGVITLYSANIDAFTDEHCRMLEIVARQSAQSLSQAASRAPSEATT
jgi:putative nucleotidyltransferase with HDIG domain